MDNQEIRNKLLINENNYSKYACLDKDAIRLRKLEDDDIRPNFYRDIDRIIYSLAYTRYIDKTQVFSNKSNDHITKRIIHVQLVSKVARTIGRALGLNEDLIEAIGLGHDIGHVPFGHVGESFLNEISKRYGEGNFMHNVESVRELLYLENNGIGTNLTIQTLDGILCHNGELLQSEYRPVTKTIDDFINDYRMCYKDEEYAKKLHPMTMEGCVVRISDIIAYLGRDIEDAVRLGVLDKSVIPDSIKRILGDSNKDIVSIIVNDIIRESIGKDYISMSPHIYDAINDLKKFNYENIYNKAYTDDERKEIKDAFNTLFDETYQDIVNNNYNSEIYKIFLNDMTEEYLKSSSNARKVIDYIAGMTDDFFMDQYKKVLKRKN